MGYQPRQRLRAGADESLVAREQTLRRELSALATQQGQLAQRAAPAERRSAMEMKKFAMEKKGMLSLRRCGLLNASRGRTTLEEAEVIKVLYNTFVSTKIAFANTAMEICHHIDGADVDVVLGVLGEAHQRLVSDRYLAAGMGDGGACHPRDNIALSHLSSRLGLSFDWFRGIMQQRERQTDWLADLIEQHRGGRDVVILGRSFKPESNIVTGSAAVLLESILRERGLPVTVWDPHVDGETKPPAGGPFCYFIGTRHPEFRSWPFEPGSVVLGP